MFFEILIASAVGYVFVHFIRRRSTLAPAKQVVINLAILGGTAVVLMMIIAVVLVLTWGRFKPKDLEFTAQQLKVFSPYKSGDTIRFVSNKAEQKVFVVTGEETSEKKERGILMALPAFNSRSLKIRDIQKGDTSSFLTIETMPQEKKRYLAVEYKNFYFRSDSNFGELHTDTLKLNGRQITGYYQLENKYGPYGDQHIVNVYWTDQDGMTGYVTEDKTEWVKKQNF